MAGNGVKGAGLGISSSTGVSVSCSRIFFLWRGECAEWGFFREVWALLDFLGRMEILAGNGLEVVMACITMIYVSEKMGCVQPGEVHRKRKKGQEGHGCLPVRGIKTSYSCAGRRIRPWGIFESSF